MGADGIGFGKVTVFNDGKGDFYITKVEVLDKNGAPVPMEEGINNEVFVPAYGNFFVPVGVEKAFGVMYQPPNKNKKYQGTLVLHHNGITKQTKIKLESE